MRAMVVAGLICVAGAAGAQGIVSGNDLHSHCQNDSARAPYFIAGVADSVTLMQDFIPNARKVCIPPSATFGQIVDVSCQYLANNPNERHVMASALVWASMLDTFPCPDR